MTMQSWYVPTINLDETVKTDRFGGTVKLGSLVSQGYLKLRTGQWVKHNDNLYQFVNLDNRNRVQLSIAGNGDNFDDRTQRFCRAVWHSKYKHDPVLARQHAPWSLSVRELRSAGVNV